MLFQEVTQAAPYINLVPWVVFLPVIGLVVNLLFGKWLGEKGVGLVGNGGLGRWSLRIDGLGVVVGSV
jgi:hypothetical protein